VASLAVMNLVYEARPGAVKGAVLRKGWSAVRGEGWIDKTEKVQDEEKKDDDGEAAVEKNNG